MNNYVFLFSTAEDLVKQRRMQRILELKAELEMLGVVVIHIDDAKQRLAQYVDVGTSGHDKTESATPLVLLNHEQWAGWQGIILEPPLRVGETLSKKPQKYWVKHSGGFQPPTRRSSKPVVTRNICRPRR